MTCYTGLVEHSGVHAVIELITFCSSRRLQRNHHDERDEGDGDGEKPEQEPVQ